MPRGHNILKGTDLDGHSFCCFKVASTASLVALTVANSASDNGPSGSAWQLLEISIKLQNAFILQRRNHMSANKHFIFNCENIFLNNSWT